MNIPEDKIQEIIQAADIVDVVSKYVRLRKTGINYKGLCPFHNEKDSLILRKCKKTDFLLFWLPQRGKCDQVFDGI
ncbi:MAG: hypothetical protein IPG53_11210 [Ignavibacteriales bacterium]|nr:hypothetical protein [Ignavibacteriales bacterium]